MRDFICISNRRKNGGARPAFSRNRGIQLARGKLIALCDDDDVWVKTDHLSTAARAMAASDA